MPYDYLHLGVLKYETGDLNGARSYLRKSIEVNDYLAEAYYYLALVEQTSGNIADFKINMDKAREYYLKGYRRFDHYTNPVDKIFLSDIERELVN
jgi:hypothetical protein